MAMMLPSTADRNWFDQSWACQRQVGWVVRKLVYRTLMIHLTRSVGRSQKAVKVARAVQTTADRSQTVAMVVRAALGKVVQRKTGQKRAG